MLPGYSRLNQREKHIRTERVGQKTIKPWIFVLVKPAWGVSISQCNQRNAISVGDRSECGQAFVTSFYSCLAKLLSRADFDGRDRSLDRGW